MKKTLAASLFIFSLLSGALFSDTEKVRFAVSPFIPLTQSAEDENAQNLASNTLEKAFMTGKWFNIQKSGDFDAFMQKCVLAQSGIGDEKVVTAEGKRLQIRYLTVGSVAKFGSHYEVDSRSVDIENWGIMHSSGCAAIDIDSACGYINKDVEITLTKENLDTKEKNAEKLPVISVEKFDEGNIAALEAGYGGTFAEVLNSELGARSNVEAIERTHLKSVIDAKQMEMCGVFGPDSNTKMNQLGIQYNVDGVINVFPSSICIRYQVTATASKRKIYIGFAEIGSVKGIRPLSRKIAREIDDAINNKIGTLQLTTKPAGADIVIDGQPFGKAPVTVSLVKGEHSIRASYAGYETSEIKFPLEPARVTDKMITLAKISSALYDQAVSLEQKKNWTGAVAKYDEYINRYNTSDDINKAMYRKGHILLLYMNNAKGSLDTFESLVKRYPDAETRAEAYFGIARAYKAMNDTANLKQTLDILYQKFPNEIATEEARMYFGGK
jgi:TolA-binding protein